MTTEEQLTLEALYNSTLSHSAMDKMMTGDWQTAVQSLYNNGYIVVWHRDEPSRIKYELSKKGRDWFLSEIEEELPFTD